MNDVVEDLAQLPSTTTVETMAGLGLNAAQIARVLKLDPEMVKARFVEEMEAGEIKANAKVAENLYRIATRDGREAVTAAIFWLKARARWKETSVHEHAPAFTHDDFVLQCMEDDAKRFGDKIEELAARHQQAGERNVPGQ